MFLNWFSTIFKKNWSFDLYLIILMPIITWACTYLIIMYSALDNVQGEISKLLYIHVPAAWLSLLIYTILVLLACYYLYSSEMITLTMSKLFLIYGWWFTFITIVTGMLWAHYTWGSFWVWDSRLITELLLLVWYTLILILYQNLKLFTYHLINKKMLMWYAFLILIGILYIPIIKYSVDWWASIHQLSSIIISTSSVSTSTSIWMLLQLFWIALSAIAVVGFVLLGKQLWIHSYLCSHSTNV